MSTSASRDDTGEKTGNPGRRHHQPRHFSHAQGNPSPAGGSSKLGVVRVGLGLLVMGDIARAYASSAAPPSFLSAAYHGRGEADIVPRRRGGRNGMDSAGKTGGFVVSGGFVGDRRRIRRRAGSSTCAVMVQQRQEQHQVSQQAGTASGQAAGAGPPSSSVAGIPASSPLSATASSTAAASSTAGPPPSSSASRTPSNGAGSSMASAAVPVSGTATVGVVDAPRRLGVISRASTDAAQGSGRRLGVVSSAENGSSAAKKAKVKVTIVIRKPSPRRVAPSAGAFLG